eukprot:CAMPEP_0170198850 /NCGR_PEP_ID=MMETSP0040_2-20121228/69016_1 /TAXON_ID=641309 /ORGANISM="Lotharella oceanica, Strain CCMP622" /LENGTH=44 /DNA_ID= /DNA_START= /DNA_END= /DNA_ORIENTATION=
MVSALSKPIDAILPAMLSAWGTPMLRSHTAKAGEAAIPRRPSRG